MRACVSRAVRGTDEGGGAAAAAGGGGGGRRGDSYQSSVPSCEGEPLLARTDTPTTTKTRPPEVTAPLYQKKINHWLWVLKASA